MEIFYSRNKRDRESWPSWDLTGASGALSARCRAAFDADHLYLDLEFRGHWGADGDRSWRYGDGVQVVISPEAVDGPVTRFTVLGASVIKGGPAVILVNRNGTWLLARAPAEARLKVRSGEDAAHYELAIPWSIIPGLDPLLDPAFGLNVTCVHSRGEGVEPALLQLTEDPDYDTEVARQRLVRRVALTMSDLKETIVKARTSRTFGADEDGTVVEVAVWSGRGGQAEVLVEARSPGRPAPRSVAVYPLEPGLNRVRHNFRSTHLATAPYEIVVQTVVNTRKSVDYTLPFYKLRTQDLDALRRRYTHAVGRASSRLSQALPSVAIRFDWLDELLGRLDPGEDPTALRLLYDELQAMVDAVENGRDPLAKASGYQRRGFRSKLDGTLQPYSVHIPPAAASAQAGQSFPLLVLLHGSGVDEVRTAEDPHLVKELDEHGWLLCAPLGRDVSGWYLGDGGRDIFEAVDSALATLPADRRLVCLGGFSMGGFGVWRHGLEQAGRFAALVVLSGRTANPLASRADDLDDRGADGPDADHTGDRARTTLASSLRLLGLGRRPEPAGETGLDADDPARYLSRAAGLPVFVAHGVDDRAVPIGPVREFVRRLEEAGARIVFRELRGAGHGDYVIWDEVFEWLEELRVYAGADAAPPGR